MSAGATGTVAGHELVLFDTNVWRHLAAHDRAMETRAALKSAGRRGAVSPLNMDELVRTPDDVQLRAMVDVACRRWWVRLMPIGFLDVEQLVSAIRRHRPEWVRRDPDWKRFAYERGAYLTNDHNSYWKAVRQHPREYADSNEQNDEVRRIQEATTREAKKVVPHFDSSRVGDAMVEPLEVSLPGTTVHGRTIESWRFQCANSVWLRLDPRESGPMGALWFDCFIERSAISPSDWWSFWADAVTPVDVSREWLRCATFHLQATRKVGPGVAGDLALVSHLVDVGAFATCDRPLFEIVEKIRPVAPVKLASVLYGPDLNALLPQLRTV